MKPKNPVRAFLKKRGSPAHVVAGELAGLLEGWEKAAGGMAAGRGQDLDDYLNDADGRQILSEALAAAPASEREALAERLAAADRQARAHLGPAEPCLWGDEEAARRGWTPAANWWYFRRPRGRN
jgi:hypothetical protein